MCRQRAETCGAKDYCVANKRLIWRCLPGTSVWTSVPALRACCCCNLLSCCVDTRSIYKCEKTSAMESKKSRHFVVHVVFFCLSCRISICDNQPSSRIFAAINVIIMLQRKLLIAPECGTPSRLGSIRWDLLSKRVKSGKFLLRCSYWDWWLCNGVICYVFSLSIFFCLFFFIRIAHCCEVPRIISRTGKATDFKFGRYILSLTGSIRTNAREKMEKRERERIEGLPKVLKYPLSGTGTIFKFCTNFHTIA